MYKKIAIQKMKETFKDAEFGIIHTLNVLENAERISKSEKLVNDEFKVVVLSAIYHDIGALEAEKKHGNMMGKYQEIEGPPIARSYMTSTDLDRSIVDRVCYIVGNHHTQEAIDGVDFRIIWEADLLENMRGLVLTQDDKQLIDFIDKSFILDESKKIAFEKYLANKYNR